MRSGPLGPGGTLPEVGPEADTVGRLSAAPPEISVVIATVGRPQQLERSLAEYESLAPGTPSFEVIVALDGEDEASRAVAARPWGFPLALVAHRRAGTGPTKNLGARAARAPYLLFLNDDTRPHPDCLLAHAAALRRHGPGIFVGHVDWDPEHEITPYMGWLAPAGHQFNFRRLAPESAIGWDACWGAHLGVPRAFFQDEPFDPDLSLPSLEDIEWGYRQARRGRTLRYLASALSFHDHRYEGPRCYRRRARFSGAAARYSARRHPELAWPLVARPALAALAATALGLFKPRRETLWDLDFRWNYVAGLLSRSDRAPAGNPVKEPP